MYVVGNVRVLIYEEFETIENDLIKMNKNI